MNPYSCEQIVIVSLFMCLHAWVDWSVWAFVTPHVWSVSVWLISWLGSFSPIFPASPEMLLSPPTCPEVSGVWGHSLPANQLVNSCQSHNSAPRLPLPFVSFLWLLKGLLLFQLFMFSDYCCFSISWPFLPIINLHNMPITYYCLPLLQLSWNSIIIFILFCLVIEAVECVSAFFFSVESTQSVISLFALCACVATMAKLCTAWAR